MEMVDAGRFRAAIDVYPVEPCLKDQPVRQSNNTILTAHLAGSIHEDFKSIGNMVVNDLEAIIKGFPPLEMQIVQPEIIHRL
jgi:phosphoglycerate dehydrogenase-like enzyme